MKKIVTASISELFIDLAAGWLGAIIIFPGLFHAEKSFEYILSLTINFSLSILSLVIGIFLRKKSYE